MRTNEARTPPNLAPPPTSSKVSSGREAEPAKLDTPEATWSGGDDAVRYDERDEIPCGAERRGGEVTISVSTATPRLLAMLGSGLGFRQRPVTKVGQA